MQRAKSVMAYFGGIDATVSIQWIMEKYHLDVVALTLDVGGFEEPVAYIQQMALAAGTLKGVRKDVKENSANQCIIPAILANAVDERKNFLGMRLPETAFARDLVEIAVLIPSDFLSRISAVLCEGHNTATIHRVAGLSMPDDSSSETSYVQTVAPETLKETIESLLTSPSSVGWSDQCDPLIFSVDSEVDRLPAPWALAWTAALAVPREMALRVGGFDESFLTWENDTHYPDFFFPLAVVTEFYRTIGIRVMVSVSAKVARILGSVFVMFTESATSIVKISEEYSVSLKQINEDLRDRQLQFVPARHAGFPLQRMMRVEKLPNQGHDRVTGLDKRLREWCTEGV